MAVRIEPGDCREVVARLVVEGVSVDAIITDPPYDLTAMAKRFGKAGAAPAQHGRDGAMSRLSGGFMGLNWDSTGIAFDPDTWRTLATILRPGGFLLAFGGTRTAHRMVCAIEDAGFVIQDTIAWMYGSGFPKRRDMLKPAFEPICVAYKPSGKRTLQIDECRIGNDGGEGWNGNARRKPLEGDQREGSALGMYNPRDRDISGWSKSGSKDSENIAMNGRNYALDPKPDNPNGRWPANVITDGSDEVMEAFPDAPGQMATSRFDDTIKTNQIYGCMRRDPEPQFPRGDAGSAARFFYAAKADSQDRWGSRHPTVKPVELIRYLVKLVCPIGGTFLDPFAGSGTAGVAAAAEGRNAILIEREDAYIADIRERMAHYEGDGRHSLASKNRNNGARAQPGTLL